MCPDHRPWLRARIHFIFKTVAIEVLVHLTLFTYIDSPKLYMCDRAKSELGHRSHRRLNGTACPRLATHNDRPTASASAPRRSRNLPDDNPYTITRTVRRRERRRQRHCHTIPNERPRNSELKLTATALLRHRATAH